MQIGKKLKKTQYFLEIEITYKKIYGRRNQHKHQNSSSLLIWNHEAQNNFRENKKFQSTILKNNIKKGKITGRRKYYLKKVISQRSI